LISLNFIGRRALPLHASDGLNRPVSLT